MVSGLGTDIVKISRLKKWLSNKALLHRYFSKTELSALSSSQERALESLAGFFAAKEAFIKAVRRTVLLKDIVLEKDSYGAPRLRLERSALKALRACPASNTLVSISHEQDYALATVLLCMQEN